MSVEQSSVFGIPPLLLVCPRLSLDDPSLAIRRMKGLERFPRHEEWQEKAVHRLDEIDRMLQESQEVLLSASPPDQKREGRRIIEELFPQLTPILGTEREKILFKGKDASEYIDSVVLPTAYGFYDWVIGQLPKSYRQNLELNEEVALCNSFSELVSLYDGCRSPLREQRGDVFNPRTRQQVTSLLGLTYVASLVDLTKTPEEEQTLDEFTRAVSNVFPRQENIYLAVGMSRGKCQQMNLATEKDDPMQIARAHSRQRLINHQYASRRFGSQPNQIFIFQQREKQPVSEMLKLLRGRGPAQDRLGVRFILGDRDHLESFVGIIQELLPDWSITEDKDRTIVPESDLTFPVKYFVSPHANPRMKIEMQIDWLTASRKTIGTWTEKRYNAGSCFEAYKMKQLLNSALPFFFPESVYGVDWKTDETRKELLDYANLQAVS